jgi:hypothetical protein
MSQFLNNHHDFRHNMNLLNSGIGSRQFFTAIQNELPPVFTRQTASRAIGGLMSPKTLSNLDSLNQGPPVKVSIGNRIGYERESFIEWLKARIRSW